MDEQDQPNRAYLSLGSNIDPELNLPAAIRLLSRYGKIARVSSVWETPPVGTSDQPPFLNAAVVLETSLSAAELKETAIAAIEHELGRKRSGNRYEPRVIDIDIMLFNSDSVRVGSRKIPDPEVLECAHVAIPLAEIAPEYRHPETGHTLAENAARFTPLPAGMFRRDEVTVIPAPAAVSSVDN